jgi:hypothetical protein
VLPSHVTNIKLVTNDIDISKLSSMRRIDFSSIYVTDDDLKKLLHVQELDLSRCNITDNGLHHITSVRGLAITSTITDNGLCRLLNLVSLKIENNNMITNNAFEYLHNLRDVHINNCRRITGKVFKYMKKVHRLIYEQGPVEDIDLRYLTNVHNLTLNNNTIRHFVGYGFRFLSILRVLKIAKYHDIADDTFAYIPNVHKLTIQSCTRLKGSCLRHVLNVYDMSLTLDKLKTLNVRDCYNLKDNNLKYLKSRDVECTVS